MTNHSDQFLQLLLRLYHPRRQETWGTLRASEHASLASYSIVPTATSSTTIASLAIIVAGGVAHSTLTATIAAVTVFLAAATVTAAAATSLSLVITS